jgi:hypothetical protein
MKEENIPVVRVLISLVVALIVIGLVVWVVSGDLNAAPADPIANLEGQISNLNYRLGRLEDKIYRLQRGIKPAEEGVIQRYCIDTYAGVMECGSCRILEDKTNGR